MQTPKLLNTEDMTSESSMVATAKTSKALPVLTYTSFDL